MFTHVCVSVNRKLDPTLPLRILKKGPASQNLNKQMNRLRRIRWSNILCLHVLTKPNWHWQIRFYFLAQTSFLYEQNILFCLTILTWWYHSIIVNKFSVAEKSSSIYDTDAKLANVVNLAIHANFINFANRVTFLRSLWVGKFSWECSIFVNQIYKGK